jgi:hypothetical protein
MPALPPDIHAIPDGDRLRLVLPPRPRTPDRWIGCVPMLFGFVFSLFAAFWMAGAAGLLDGPPAAPPPGLPAPEAAPPAPLPAPPPDPDWTRWLVALFGVPFLLAGLMPIALGLALIVPGHAEILFTADDLVAVSQVGPLRLSRRRKLAQLTGLRVMAGVPGIWGGMARTAIAADCGPARRPIYLAARYPPQVLEPLAAYLADEWKRRNTSATLRAGSAPPALPVTVDPPPTPVRPRPSPAPPPPASSEPPPPQPPGSTITFVPAADSLTFAVPRTGFRGVALFFLIFAVFWDGITFTAAGAFLWDFFHHPRLNDLFLLAFLSIFVIAGVGVALAAVQLAFRRAVILATPDALIYTQQGPIRNAEYQWTSADLASVHVGDSGTTVNNRRLQELKIAARDGTTRGFFDGRDNAELHWLAATLRAFYRL